MPPSPPRRLNLLDGMILLAGLAACFLLTQVYGATAYPRFAAMLRKYDDMNRYRGRPPFGPLNLPPELPLWWTVAEAIKVATFWLATFSPIVLWLRLRQPRPPGRRLFLQPGAVATLTATLVTIAGVVLWFLASTLTGRPPGLFLYRQAFTNLLVTAGPAIAVMWACLALAGRWRGERGPVDRAGRLLGVGWIVAFLLLAWSNIQTEIATRAVPGQTNYLIINMINELDL